MPGNATAIHPNGLKLTFNEADHSYVDEIGRDYTSVTTLIHSAFPKFNAEGIAAAKSAKTGVPAAQYIAEWDMNRNKAANDGTRAHENCEYQFLGQYGRMHQPVDELERARFNAGWNEVRKMQSYSEARINPELIVFSPRFRVAGSIDLLVSSDGGYMIVDWKFIKELKVRGFRGECGLIYPTRSLQHCNFIHYSLQLSIYELLLKTEGYIPADAGVDRWLYVYNRESQTFNHVSVPFMEREAALLLAYHVTEGASDVPF